MGLQFAISKANELVHAMSMRDDIVLDGALLASTLLDIYKNIDAINGEDIEFEIALHALDLLSPSYSDPLFATCALWFSHARCDTDPDRNRIASSKLASTTLQACGVSIDIAERIAGIVSSVADPCHVTDIDAAVIVDARHWIWGASAARYDWHAAACRWRNYEMSTYAYALYRVRFLEALAHQSYLYFTPLLSGLWSLRAHQNMAREMVLWKGVIHACRDDATMPA